MQPDLPPQSATVEPAMATPAALPEQPAPTSALEPAATPVITPTEDQSMATELQAPEGDPLVESTMDYLTFLSTKAKGNDFVDIASASLKFAQEYADAKAGKR